VVSGLAADARLSEVLAHLLVLRGIPDPLAARQFIEPDPDSSFHDPFLMKGMKRACTRLIEAREREEAVMVHGDYDADGITSLAVLMRFFRGIGIACSPYIPKRLTEGYGFSRHAVTQAVDQGVGLIVTADCGIRAIAEAAEAREAGIDVIVTDHHQPAEHLPDACSVLNPKQEGCTYPGKDLSGVGVAWKLCQALYSRLNGAGDDPAGYLDLVCLGSVADVVPITGENRAIIRLGLKQISTGGREGVRALITSSSLDPDRMTYRDVAFVLAPRVNAAGRLGSAERALRLLTTDDADEAFDHAAWLEDENRRRREIDSRLTEEVRGTLAREFDSRSDYAVIMASRHWHPGVIGIVASRVVEEYYRPTILISIGEDGIGRGSARSIPEFPIYQALVECSSYLEEFGGHSYAAGLKIKESNIASFREDFLRVARDQLGGMDLRPTLMVDLELGMGTISGALVRELKVLEPYGPGNPEPLFCLRDVLIADSPRVLRRNTLKFSVSHNGMMIDVVGFGKGDYVERIHKGSRVDMVVRLEQDTWRGEEKVGMKLEDIKLKGNATR